MLIAAAASAAAAAGGGNDEEQEDRNEGETYSEIDAPASEYEQLLKEEDEACCTTRCSAKSLLVFNGFLYLIAAVCLITQRTRSVAYFDCQDDTKILFLDGMWCVNGNCTEFSEMKGACDNVQNTFKVLRNMSFVVGIVMFFAVGVVFSALFLRSLSYIINDVFKFRKCLDLERALATKLGEVSTTCYAAFALFVMLGLVSCAIVIIIKSLYLIYSPLCEGQTNSLFNTSLIDQNHFERGRAILLNVFGASGVIVAFLSNICFFIGYICVNFNKYSGEDEYSAFEGSLRGSLAEGDNEDGGEGGGGGYSYGAISGDAISMPGREGNNNNSDDEGENEHSPNSMVHTQEELRR